MKQRKDPSREFTKGGATEQPPPWNFSGTYKNVSNVNLLVDARNLPAMAMPPRPMELEGLAPDKSGLPFAPFRHLANTRHPQTPNMQGWTKGSKGMSNRLTQGRKRNRVKEGRREVNRSMEWMDGFFKGKSV